MSMDPPVMVEITDVFPEAVRGPAGKITAGCFTFDVMGNRYRVTRVWKGKKAISLAHESGSSADVTWDLDEQVTYIPAPTTS